MKTLPTAPFGNFVTCSVFTHTRKNVCQIHHQSLVVLGLIPYGVSVQGYICHCKRLKIRIDLLQGIWFCFFPQPYYYPRTILALPPRCNLDPGPHRGRSPIPTTVPSFFLVAINIQHFHPSLTRVESYLPTLLGAFSS